MLKRAPGGELGIYSDVPQGFCLLYCLATGSCRYPVSPGMHMANTTSKYVPVFLEFSRGRVHGNVLFRDIYLLELWPAIGGPVGAMCFHWRAYIIPTHIYAVWYVGDCLEPSPASLTDSHLLLYHWTCSLIWCLRTFRTHLFLFQGMLSRPGGASFLWLCYYIRAAEACVGAADNLCLHYGAFFGSKTLPGGR